MALSGGALGALIKEILEDNGLTMPELKNGTFYLGFFGAMIIGGAAGYFIDGSFLNSFLGGYVGKSILERLSKTNELILKPAEIGFLK